jgi:hypothetical protein
MGWARPRQPLNCLMRNANTFAGARAPPLSSTWSTRLRPPARHGRVDAPVAHHGLRGPLAATVNDPVDQAVEFARELAAVLRAQGDKAGAAAVEALVA